MPKLFKKSSHTTVALLLAILAVGSFLRLLNFPNVPYGLNQDEMNAGYEAWSLLNFGTDRWGEKWPVYFLSWGSGQNVLYSYYLIPFIAVFGPTDFTVRLGMVVVGILLPLIVFFLAKLWFSTKPALLSSAITAIFPELIKGSRWAVESNFVPFCLALGLLCFSLALLNKNAKKLWIVLSLVPLALLPYAYIITIIPVVFTVLAVFWWQRKALKENKTAWIFSFIIFCGTLIPLGLFLLKTVIFGNKTLFFENWLPFSIPAMEESRLQQIAEESAGGNIPNPLNTLFNNLKYLFTGTYPNQIGGGMDVAHISLGFVLIAIAASFIPLFKKSLPFSILHIWIIASLPIIFFVPLSNIRGNLFYVPSIILVCALITASFNLATSKFIKILFIAGGILYAIYVSVWFYAYQAEPLNHYFYKDIRTAVDTIESVNEENIPVLLDTNLNQINIPYIQLMWLLLLPPEQIAENPEPKTQLENYYFDAYYLPVGEPYYEIFTPDFSKGCYFSNDEGSIVYGSNGWKAYKCAPIDPSMVQQLAP